MYGEANRKTIAIEKIDYYTHRSEQKGAHHVMGREGGTREPPGPVRGRGSRENVDKILYCGFSGKEQVSQTKRE